MIRRMTTDDAPLFWQINEEIMQTLTDPEWFIPFPADADVFSPEHDVFFGWFEGDELAGVSGVILDEKFLGDLRVLLHLEGKKIGEVGGSMVRPKFRGRNIMWELNRHVLQYAKDNDFDCLVATIHPDNVASRTSAEHIGLKKVDCIKRKGHFLRNVYLLQLK